MADGTPKPTTKQGGDSLEKVITFYVDLAEKRCNEARKQADAAAVAAASARITDLENDVVRAYARMRVCALGCWN